MTHPDVSALVAALEPFAKLAGEWSSSRVRPRLTDGYPISGVTYGDLRRAARALALYRAQPPAPPQEEGERLCKRTLEKAAEVAEKRAAAIRAEINAATPAYTGTRKELAARQLEDAAAAIRALAEED